MAITKIVKQKVRRDTAANFASGNPVMSVGEVGFETDARKTRMGDGSTAFASLPISAKGYAPFNTAPLLIADTTLTTSNTTAGDIITAQGFNYQVVDSGGHITTAGGIQFKILPSPDGSVNILAFGAIGNGVTDDTVAIQTAVTNFMYIIIPDGTFIISATIREATNGGARRLEGSNRLTSKLKASASLAASGLPIFWFGNSNGHGNYRLRFENVYLDGGDIGGNGASGAIGLRAHECGTSYIDNLYIAGCLQAIHAIGIIGTTIGGGQTEIHASQEGIICTKPTGGGVALGGDDVLNTESWLSLSNNINHISDIWFSTIKGTCIRVEGGLTEVDHITLQACGGGPSDDLISFINANESYDYGGGPAANYIWCEGGAYRSIITVKDSRDASIGKCFFSGAGAATEQAIILDGAENVTVGKIAVRGGFTATPTGGRLANASVYVHANCGDYIEIEKHYYTKNTIKPYYEGEAAPTAFKPLQPFALTVVSISAGLATEINTFNMGIIPARAGVGMWRIYTSFNKDSPSEMFSTLCIRNLGASVAISSVLKVSAPSYDEYHFYDAAGALTDPDGFSYMLYGQPVVL